jgi:hypothetical protein
MSQWHTIETAPAQEMVWTKIEDEHGERNVQKLVRRGQLWFTGTGQLAMYVYYTPTHWTRALPSTERATPGK